jgi:diguanylate cyclase (GGDEF)-like protein
LASKPVEVRVCRIAHEDKGLYGVVLAAVDATPAGAQDGKLMRHDPLTGLHDRDFLSARLAELLGPRRTADNRFAVLFVDLDNFKQVNDEYGHLVGDSVLREVAQRLKNCVRADDHVVRFGGDEFVVLAEQLSTPSDIDSIVRRLHGVLKSPIVLPQGAINLTLSIGVSEASADCHSADDVLAAADRAMYAAKRSSI